MTLHDDRTFIRHFSWVLGGLLGITIFFIFLAFLIVGMSGVDNRQGYTFVPPQKQQQQKSAASGASSAMAGASAGGAASAGTAVASNAASNGSSGGGAAAAAAAGSSGKQVASNAAPDGKSIWEAHCAMCHQTGLVGAPKIGDKQAWSEILSSTDMKTIFQHDIDGYTGKLGTMPPKGGNPSLSDDEVIAAAKYMIGQSGGNPGS